MGYQSIFQDIWLKCRSPPTDNQKFLFEILYGDYFFFQPLLREIVPLCCLKMNPLYLFDTSVDFQINHFNLSWQNNIASDSFLMKFHLLPHDPGLGGGGRGGGGG